MSGLLIGGRLVPVQGVDLIAPGEKPWAKLDPGDYMLRDTKWPRQIVLHTTKGIWPQRIIPGKGKGDRDKVVADFWRGDPEHSAAQIVVDNDGTGVCLVDILQKAAYHATTANEWSVGIEIYQELDGGIYEAALVSTVEIVKTLCDELPTPIPFQGSVRQYNNLPLKRMIAGLPGKRGLDCVGVFGHRDVAWDYKKKSSTRGRGDPGDFIVDYLVKAGMLAFDYDARADLAYWTAMQTMARMQGETDVVADGICGPATIAAMKKLRLWRTAHELRAA